MKKSAYPSSSVRPAARRSTITPEKPLANLPTYVYAELRSAYCVAVYPRLVRLDMYVTSATPAKPIPKLSAKITAPNTRTSGPAYAIVAKLAITRIFKMTPAISVLMYPKRSALKPPAAMPSSVAARPTDARTAPTASFERPRS